MKQLRFLPLQANSQPTTVSRTLAEYMRLLDKSKRMLSFIAMARGRESGLSRLVTQTPVITKRYQDGRVTPDHAKNCIAGEEFCAGGILIMYNGQ